LETFGLAQHVTFATHNSGHCLDLIITRSSNDVIVDSPRPSLFLSDHCFSECILDIPSSSVTTKKVSFRKLKSIDLTALKNDITASELNNLPGCELSAKYDSTLRAILDKHAPLQHKMLTFRPKIPWFNDALKEMKKNRRKLEKKMRKSKLPCDIAAYKRSCEEYCSSLKQAKSDYFSALIQDCAGDSRKLFKVVNLLCKERSSDLLPPHTCSRQLADDFGDYFCRKITLIKEKIQSCSIDQPAIVIPSPSVKFTSFSQLSD